LRPVNHASVLQDDEEVSALKEQIMDMQARQAQRDNEAQGVIDGKDEQISRMQDTINNMQRQIDKDREERDRQGKDINR
jgi:hypothetical protein